MATVLTSADVEAYVAEHGIDEEHGDLMTDDVHVLRSGTVVSVTRWTGVEATDHGTAAKAKEAFKDAKDADPEAPAPLET